MTASTEARKYSKSVNENTIPMYELDDFRGQFISTGSPGRPEYIWSRERKFDFVACEQQRRRPACASTQFDQRLCSSLILKFEYLNLLPVKCQHSG